MKKENNTYKKYCKRILKQYGKNLIKTDIYKYNQLKNGKRK